MFKYSPQLFWYITLFIFFHSMINAQDFDVACRLAQPFCSDESRELTFPNTTGDINGLGEVGCLNTTPNPSWYFLRIDQPGELVFDIKQWMDTDEDSRLDRDERQLDVDFVAWGPFPTSFVVCDILSKGCDLNGDGENISGAECFNNADEPDFYINNEDNTNIIDCSYARQPEETIFIEKFTIPNALQGEYYIILINNFADEAGVIQLEQTNLEEEGAGTTDCSILEPGIAPENIATCGEYPIIVEGRYPGNSATGTAPAETYQWARADIGSDVFTDIPRATLPFLEIDQDGVYRLSGFDASGAEVANSPDSVAVLDVSVMEFDVAIGVEEESFSGSYTIIAQALTSEAILEAGFTNFEYRLEREVNTADGFLEYREYQSSPIFENVPPGDYQVTVRYANCPDNEVTSTEILMILGYPKYFTPNGDGFHETWNLINAENQAAASLYIFDRNGKLLKQLNVNGAGWDGTYNGKLMPSSEYWFRVEFNEPTDPEMRKRTFAGSFSLIR